MRVTEGMRYSQVLSNLSSITSQHAKASQQASSGLRVGKPSDDPIAAAELARLRASSSQTSTHLSTIDTVRGDAELTESTLSEATDIFVRLKEIALQAANGGLTPDERQTMGVEVAGMKNSLLSLGNARGTRGYLFSGSQVTTPAFDENADFRAMTARSSCRSHSAPTAVTPAAPTRSRSQAAARVLRSRRPRRPPCKATTAPSAPRHRHGGRRSFPARECARAFLALA